MQKMEPPQQLQRSFLDFYFELSHFKSLMLERKNISPKEKETTEPYSIINSQYFNKKNSCQS